MRDSFFAQSIFALHLVPVTYKEKRPTNVGLFSLVGDEGLEPPTLSV